MKVIFYNFSKRINSTIQPSTLGTEYDCVLKNPTSIMHPVIVLKATAFSYNYAYIATFGRYYFVDDIVSVSNDVTEYHLTEDAMASGKTAIGNTKAYVAYSSSNYHTNIRDPRILAKAKNFEHYATAGSTMCFDVTLTGCYIMTTMSQGGGAAGIGNIYMMTAAELATFANAINDTSLAAALIQYFDGQMKNSILSLIWVPFLPSSLSSSFYDVVDTIELGPDDTKNITGVSTPAKKLKSFGNYKDRYTIAIHHKYPKTDFRAMEPYTSGNLWLPGVGLITLSMSDLIEADNVVIDFCAEYPTGAIHYDIYNDAGSTVIQTVQGNVAAACPLGQIAVNGAGVVSGIKTAVTGVATMLLGSSGLAFEAGSAAILAGTANAVMSYNQRATSITGSVTGRYWNPGLMQIHYIEFAKDTIDPDNADYIARKGRPLGEVVQINTLSGYIECDGASVSGDMNSEELERINNFMNSGFYYA